MYSIVLERAFQRVDELRKHSELTESLSRTERIRTRESLRNAPGETETGSRKDVQFIHYWLVNLIYHACM